MPKRFPDHGGPDGGPIPRYDFSSNSNPTGPCPQVLAAVRSADITQYPDPSYTALRTRLAKHHHVSPEQIVVGAGASELILRLVRHTRGSVHVLGPTFSEYARSAQLNGRACYQARTAEEFMQLRHSRRGLGFICWPNNPTGTMCATALVAEAAASGPLVVDLAYAPLAPAGSLAQIETAAAHAIRLYAPNKSFGLTGIRAAYAITPKPMPALVMHAPTWVLGKPGEAFLHAAVESKAQRWLTASRSLYEGWRRKLAQAMRDRGCEVQESPATYLLARVGNARRIYTGLLQRDVRVRDCTSFDLPEWIRLSAQPPEAQEYLLNQYDALTTGDRRTR